MDHFGRWLAGWHPIVDGKLQLHSTTLAALTLANAGPYEAPIQGLEAAAESARAAIKDVG